MKKALLLLTVIVFIAGCSTAQPSTAGPRIYFDEDSVDLGKLAPGVSLDYTFHFENVGNEPLIIEDVWARAEEGCCPPHPVVYPTTLQPGDEGTLRIQKSYREGLHLFEITVKSNDPVEPEKKLYLTVDWKPME